MGPGARSPRRLQHRACRVERTAIGYKVRQRLWSRVDLPASWLYLLARASRPACEKRILVTPAAKGGEGLKETHTSVCGGRLARRGYSVTHLLLSSLPQSALSPSSTKPPEPGLPRQPRGAHSETTNGQGNALQRRRALSAWHCGKGADSAVAWTRLRSPGDTHPRGALIELLSPSASVPHPESGEVIAGSRPR